MSLLCLASFVTFALENASLKVSNSFRPAFSFWVRYLKSEVFDWREDLQSKFVREPDVKDMVVFILGNIGGSVGFGPSAYVVSGVGLVRRLVFYKII